MRILVDTSAVLCVLLNQESKAGIIAKTTDATLIAPASLHWEIGNALSSLIKRKKIDYESALEVVEEYRKVPIQFVDADLKATVIMADKHKMYAYDAYMVVCAKQFKIPMLTLDGGLAAIAKKEKIKVLEV